jgi:hypothetical protein
MGSVLRPRSWIFWWAGLTATVFLQDLLQRLASFFRDQVIFSPNIPPFSLVAGLDDWIDGNAEYIRTTVKFKPDDVLAGVGPVSIHNWMMAAFLGALILIIVGILYVRALNTDALMDDVVALVVLYFVIRIEAQLVSIARFPTLSAAGSSVIQNPGLAFVILMVLLAVLVLGGGGLNKPRSIWRGLIEGLLLAILLFPIVAGGAVAVGIEGLGGFGSLLQKNLTFGVLWGVIGMGLALRQLYYADAKA